MESRRRIYNSLLMQGVAFVAAIALLVRGHTAFPAPVIPVLLGGSIGSLIGLLRWGRRETRADVPVGK